MAQFQHYSIIKAALFRALLFALIWWSFTGGSTTSWMVGIPAIIIAVYISIKLEPASQFSISGLLRFTPFFIQHSVSGGLDVALRAIRPQLNINPDIIEFKPRLTPGIQEYIMLITVNLLPGTLCTSLQDGNLQIHVIDKSIDYLSELKSIEARVADIFSLQLEQLAG